MNDDAPVGQHSVDVEERELDACGLRVDRQHFLEACWVEPLKMRQAIAEDGRDLVGRFRALAPRKDPIAVQRWSVRRIVLTVRTAILVAGTAALLAVNLANPRAP